MKARYIGDALLRPNRSPLLSFLAPSFPPVVWGSSTHRNTKRFDSLQCCFQKRRLTTSTALSIASPSTAKQLAEDESPVTQQPVPDSNRKESDDAISAQLQSLLQRHKSLDASTQSPQIYNTPSQLNANQRPSANRWDMAYQEDRRSKNYLQARQGKIADSMAFPDDVFSGFAAKQEAVRQNVNAYKYILEPLPTPVRLDAYIGRSENVDPVKGRDLGRTIRLMESKLAYNSVRAESMRQRFYERPGLKRKRLKILRWKKRFRAGFRDLVGKVKEMRRKGW